MKFEELLHIVRDEVVFETGLLLAGDVNANDVRKQLSRWVKANKLVQLRRGLYMLGRPYRNYDPRPFKVANLLVPGSYISCESALSFYGIIPEHTFQHISVTMGRSGIYSSSSGRFQYRHLKHDLYFGYTDRKVSEKETVFIARPEKALLDLITFFPGADSHAFLKELRLNFEMLDMDKINDSSRKAGVHKLTRAANTLTLLSSEQQEYQQL